MRNTRARKSICHRLGIEGEGSRKRNITVIKAIAKVLKHTRKVQVSVQKHRKVLATDKPESILKA